MRTTCTEAVRPDLKEWPPPSLVTAFIVYYALIFYTSFITQVKLPPQEKLPKAPLFLSVQVRYPAFVLHSTYTLLSYLPIYLPKL